MVTQLFHYSKIVLVNVIFFLAFFMFIEISARMYAEFFIDGKSFFRERLFISPWITTIDYPPPRIDAQNNAFFRHKDTPVKLIKENGLKRIIAVGGSTTANETAYKAHKTDYQHELEGLLNSKQRGEKYEVLNAGGDSYSTAQALINIQFRLVEFSPDLIILMNNLNDLSVKLYGKRISPDYSNKYMRPFFLAPELQGGLSLYGLLNQSRVLMKLRIPALFLDKEKEVENAQYGFQIFKRNLKHIAAICDLHNIDLLLLSQPLLWNDQHQGFHEYNNAIKQVADDSRVHYFDMHTNMGQEPDLFTDTIHYTLKGVKKFSALLAPVVSDILEKRKY
jgi:lysophospholipase L1-like esterase